MYTFQQRAEKGLKKPEGRNLNFPKNDEQKKNTSDVQLNPNYKKYTNSFNPLLKIKSNGIPSLNSDLEDYNIKEIQEHRGNSWSASKKLVENPKDVSKNKKVDENDDQKNNKYPKNSRKMFNIWEIDKDTLNLMSFINKSYSFSSKPKPDASTLQTKQKAFNKTTKAPVLITDNSKNISRQTWKNKISDQNLSLLNLSEAEMLRQEVMFEIIETEKEYLRDLDVLLELYYKDLLKLGILKTADIKSIFLNDFESRWLCEAPILSDVADILVHWVGSFSVYTEFISGYTESLDKVNTLRKTNTKFAEFCKNYQKNPTSRGLPLESFLLIPFQRLLKYPLLLSNLSKVTDSLSEASMTIKEAQKKLKNEIESIQEAKDFHDNLKWLRKFESRIKNLDGFELAVNRRKFLGFGNGSVKTSFQILKKVGKKSSGQKKSYEFSSEVSMWIFSDVLLIGKPLKLNKPHLAPKSQTSIKSTTVEHLFAKTTKKYDELEFASNSIELLAYPLNVIAFTKKTDC
ncbi:hypothetical protein BB560_003484, partial [Smittium megazygosporum]